MRLENYKLFFLPALCSIVLILSLLRLLYGAFTPGWDESVYLSMGKYYWSFGHAGILESLRPPIVPLLFGFFWIIGPQVLLSKILEIGFFLGIIIVGYYYAQKVYSKKVAILFSLLLAASPLLFHFSGRLLSELPSLFFLMLGFLLFSHEKWFFAGLAFSFAFLTKFPSGIVLLSLLIGLYWYYNEKTYYWVFAGFFLPVTLYAIANRFMFGDIFHPFLLGSHVIEQAGLALYSQPWWFYPVELAKENVITIFSLIALFLLLPKKEVQTTTFITTALLLLGYFSSLAHKETRFMILFFPLFLLLGCYALWTIYDRYEKKRYIATRLAILAIIVIFQILSGFQNYSYYEIPTDQQLIDEYYNDINTVDDTITVWVSNPLFGAYSDKQPKLLYYPLFTDTFIDSVEKEWDETENLRVYFSTCDIPCGTEEKTCLKKQERIVRLVKHLEEVKRFEAHGCEWIIAKKITENT